MSEQTHQLVKRFVAPSMTRALELVQQELGPEAVILSSKRVAKGVEIVTSLEPDLPTRGIDVRREFGQNFDADLDRALPSDSAWRSQAGIEQAAASYGGQTERNAAGSFPSRPPAELAKEIEAARERMLAAKRDAKRDAKSAAEASESAPRSSDTPSVSTTHARQYDHRAQSDTGNDDARLSSLQNELADMRMLLEQQLWYMSDKKSDMPTLTMPGQVNMPNNHTVVSEHLSRLGLIPNIVDSLIEGVGHGVRASAAWRECMATLAKQVPILAKPMIDQPGVYAFLGQTGVGKTTSIGKLAAQHVLKHGPGKVALVTTDTFRVGATDQLRTMGRILNVPVRVVDAENSLLTVLASLRQFPLILIDTAGFRMGDPMLKAQLSQLDACASIKRVLVLACNSQMQTMKAAVHAHRSKRVF